MEWKSGNLVKPLPNLPSEHHSGSAMLQGVLLKCSLHPHRAQKPHPQNRKTWRGWNNGNFYGWSEQSLQRGHDQQRPLGRSVWVIRSGHEFNFFCFLFVKNHRRANQWPLVRETLFSVVPPSKSLVSVSNPWLALCVASGTTEIHGHRQASGARHRGPRTPSTTTAAHLIVLLLIMHFLPTILDVEKLTE